MPLYSYKVLTKKNGIIEDTIFAANSDDAAAMLVGAGYKVLSVRQRESKNPKYFIGSISITEKAMFCRFLATMLHAGLSLPEAVEIIRQDMKNPRLRKILSDVIFQIQKGQTVSSVLGQYKEDFDPVFLTIIKAGEDSGNIDAAFSYVAEQLLATHDLIQKVRSALMYPAVIVVAMFGVGMIIITFVLPRVATAFSNLNMQMPLPTKLLFGFGNFVNDNLFFVLGVIGFSIVTIVILFVVKQTRKAIFSVFIRLPAARDIVVQYDVARFSRTLSTLLHSGVSVIDALNISAETVSQDRLRMQAKRFSEGVAQGISLGEVITKGHTGFPVTLIQTIRAGEKTGKLDEVLIEMAEFYEKEVDYTLKRFTALLEPVLMLGVGVAVGAMVLMIIAPIYSIVGGLQETISR